MNAESYLRKQGWKGSGHSLDSTGRGIKRPLLITHKQDQLGLGKKKAAYTTDDQWWMRAFDQSLQSIGSGKESTLSQIRTKGINRGGLYGFFVKGEEIAGTIDDTSTDATDASMPSGASTPPTSEFGSDAEAPAKRCKMSEQTNKRKREDNDTPATKKKKKTKGGEPLHKDDKMTKEPRVKSTPRDTSKSKCEQLVASPEEQAAVDRKMAKLSPQKKARYEEKLVAKGQTVEQYLLRRVQKSNKEIAKRNKRKAIKAARTAPATTTPMFITDLEGDATLAQSAVATNPGHPVLTPDAATAEALAKKEEKRQKRKEKKEAKKLLPSKKSSKSSDRYKSRNDDKQAMKEKKERAKAKKIEKA